MRHIRIHCTVTETQAGSVLLDLAEHAVTQLDFESVEVITPPQNENRPSPKHTNGGALQQLPSRATGTQVPEMFAPVLQEIKNQKGILTGQNVREVLAANGRSPNSFSYALDILLRKNLIRRHPHGKVGVYEVV